MKKTLLLPLVLIFITSLQLSSCKKKEEEQTTKLTVTVKLYGDTVEDATVELYDEDDDLVGTKTTNSHGKVVFDDIDPGTYEVLSDYDDGQLYYIGGGIYNVKKGQNKKVTIDLQEY